MTSFLSLGEIMIEFAPAEAGLYRKGYAGDTFNTAWYARRLLPEDWSVSYGTVIGQDAASDEMAAFIAGEGLATDALRRHPTRTVGLYTIQLKDGERSFSYWRSAAAARSLADDPDWLAHILQGRARIHFSGITLAILAPDARDRFCAALAAARAGGAHVSFDTNLRPRLWESEEAMRDGLTLGGAQADTVLPSFDEEQAIFADARPEDTVARYAAGGATCVVVKNGAAPVLAWSAQDGAAQVMPPHVPDVVDSTAAGDSFAAAFLAAQAQGLSAARSAARACDLAARVIQHRGALAPALFASTL